jgi:hypothetical protein
LPSPSGIGTELNTCNMSYKKTQHDRFMKSALKINPRKSNCKSNKSFAIFSRTSNLCMCT